MVLLSFDIEEFDVPREHGVDYDTLREGMQVSVQGTERILDILRANDVRATFFCTGNFAEHAPEVMRRIVSEGHEVACHGVDHWQPQASDVACSKEIIERVSGVKAYGYRQPRMFPVSDEALSTAGYTYNSSLNPAFIPGRYMHLTAPRTWFMRDGVMQIPASVTPWLRFPLFWLSLHNLPEWLYHWLVRRTLGHDGYFVTYFHPWEFYELREHPELRMPFIIRNHSGQQLCQRLDRLIRMLKQQGEQFGTFKEFVEKGGVSKEGGSVFARFVRFGIVGVVASGIHYGVYALALTLGCEANIAYSAGFLVSLCCNYLLTTYFTFRQRPSRRNAVGFAASHVLNYFVEIALLNLFLWMGFSEWTAPLLDMAVAAGINFLVLQLAFRK